jgi:hypothetical protein
MAALAESLVDEWLNRQGFFSVRGVRHGNDEIDLLAVRPQEATLEAWHVEVQASFRPIGYITRDKSGSHVKSRSTEILQVCVADWIEHKFESPSKSAARERAWPGLEWQKVFVHATVKYDEELLMLSKAGMTVIPLHKILGELKHAEGHLRGGAGTDLAEIIEYYNEYVNAG